MPIADHDRSCAVAAASSGRMGVALGFGLALALSLCGLGSSSALAQDFGQARVMADVLMAHNQIRAAANVPPMTWNARLAEGAARWAEHLAQSGYMMHSQSKEGENIWMGTSGAFSHALMVRDWANEGRFYRAGYFPNISSTGDWRDVGHFTQMVWRDTRQLGCAIASRDGWDVLVCRYNSPGNVVGKRPY